MTKRSNELKYRISLKWGNLKFSGRDGQSSGYLGWVELKLKILLILYYLPHLIKSD